MPTGKTIQDIEFYSDRTSQWQLRVARRPAPERHEVVVTGAGFILANCDASEIFWQQLKDGESQLAIELDPADQLPCAVGRVREFECREYLRSVPEHLYASCHREQQFYLASLGQACADAGIELGELASERVGLFDGTSRGPFAFWHEVIERRLRDPGKRLTLRDLNLGMPGQAVGLAAAILGVQGPTYTFNGTCASGAIAIGHAFRELQAGRIDLALGTGHDAALIGPMFQMYREARLLSHEGQTPAHAIRPYSGNSTNAFGEGAVTLVLETRERAEVRGARILAQVVAFRHGNGGEHPTDVDFTGERPARLISAALDEAELTTDDVDFVVGHGNGVQVSDLSELNYMKRLFRRRTRDVPLISTKPIYGHTLGASSAVNAAAAALMLHHGYLIPTVGVDETRTVQGFNHQAGGGLAKPLRTGIVMAYGIGGQNATLILRKAQA